MAIKKAKIITITSVKGGTGKTTFALSLAGRLSLKEKSVLIIDLDLYESAIAISTGADPDRNIFTLVDDLKNNRYKSEIDYVSKYNDYISILPALKDPRTANKITSKYVGILLSKLKTRYDFIIIDTNHTMNEINLTAIDNSDETFYIIEKDPIQAKNMKTIISIFGDIEKDNYHIILNESIKKKKSPLKEYDINRMLDGKIEYVIPSSFTVKNIDSYVLDGKIIVLDKKLKSQLKKGINVIDKIVDFLSKIEE